MTAPQKNLVIAMGELTRWLAGMTDAALKLDEVLKELQPDADPEFELLRKRFLAARPQLLRIGLAASQFAALVDPTNQSNPAC